MAFNGADIVIPVSENIARDEPFEGQIMLESLVRGNIILLDLVKLGVIELMMWHIE